MEIQYPEVISRAANAIEKLMRSASPHLGSDCILHAKFGRDILADHGINTRLVIGEAAWRVGSGDGDLIVHSPSLGGVGPANVQSLAFHAWLEMDDTIIDFTTYSLRVKAQTLDAIDGGQTNVSWCPPYIVMPRSQSLPLKDVVQAPCKGVACYQEIPTLRQHMVKLGLEDPLDDSDMMLLRMIMKSPGMRVFGPNSDEVRAEMECVSDCKP